MKLNLKALTKQDFSGETKTKDNLLLFSFFAFLIFLFFQLLPWSEMTTLEPTLGSVFKIISLTLQHWF